jgi:hypothetical protein
MTGTIRAVIDGKYRIAAHCNACHYSTWLDMQAMAERYGMDAPVRGPRQIGRGLLACSRCGSDNCSMRIHPDLPPMGPLPR